jgi:hypothetical protein
MNGRSTIIMLILGIICVALSISLIVVARSNQTLQLQAQAQQQALSAGLLGQQGRQISTAVLQDMAATGTNSVGIQDILVRYGYRQAPGGANP